MDTHLSSNSGELISNEVRTATHNPVNASMANGLFKADPQVRQLDQLNDLYRQVTEVTNDCLWEWDLQNKEIFWIDGGHQRSFGYPVWNALVPQSFWESCLHPQDRDRVLKKLNASVSNQTITHWEERYRFKRLDGTYAHVQDRGHIIHQDTSIKMVGATQDITQWVLTEQQLKHEIDSRQREITQAVLTAHENERIKIGQELHDNVNQILGAVKLYLEMAKTDKKHLHYYLDRSSGYIRQVIDEIRQIARTLLPPKLHFMNLFDGIRALLEDLHMIQPVKIQLNHKGVDLKLMNEEMQLDLFRIVQEQMNNILKHADASAVYIEFRLRQNELELIIGDNGKGCDLSKHKEGVGIRNIQSRAELHHGNLYIESSPGNGYCLRVSLPVGIG